MHIAIVGGGASGVLVLAQAVRQAATPLSITLIEPGNLARGIAYGTPTDAHLLNVRASNMGAFPDDGEDFARWARLPPDVFAPRRLYGAYLEHVLAQAMARAQEKNIAVRILRTAAVALERDRLALQSGETLPITHLVLATGNTLPARPRFVDDTAWQDPGFLRNPWDAESLARTAASANTILIIGTGLTALDVILSLREQGYQGAIHCISRHGLLPLPHAHTAPVQENWQALTQAGQLTALQLLTMLRRTMRHAPDWRACMDALRPITPALWQKLPARERKRAMARLFTYWNIHRHRVAPEIADTIAAMQQSGQLQVRPGHISRISAGLQVKENGRAWRADAAINATGPDYALSRSENPLLQNLLSQGAIQPHATGLGLAAQDFRATGTAAIPLYALGAPVVGEYFECTAVPNIRGDAQRIAAQMTDDR